MPNKSLEEYFWDVGITNKSEKGSRRNVVWEDEQTINLVWYVGDNKFNFVFGKRAPVHYKCPLDNRCFTAAIREFVLREGKMLVMGKNVRPYTTKEEWESFFEDKESNDNDGEETVVIEEQLGMIHFYTHIYTHERYIKSKIPRSKMSLFIEDDEGVACPCGKDKQNRPCAEHPMVSFVTYRPPSLFNKKQWLSVSTFDEVSAFNII